MITTTGAASLVASPKRLKPKSPKSPRNTTMGSRLNQQARNSPPSLLQSRGSSPYGSTPSSQSFLLGRTNSLPASARSPPDRQYLVLDTGGFGRSGHPDFSEEDFFGLHPLSASSLEGCHEPPSPRSFYSAATTSSASTTKAGGGHSSEDESSVATVTPTQLQKPPSPNTSRKLRRSQPSSPPSSSDRFMGNRVGTGSSPRSQAIGSFAGYSGSHLSGHPPAAGTQYAEQQPGVRDFEIMSSNNLIRDFCIAVVGARGAGKSTFIQKAYDLKAPPSEDAVTTKLMTIDRSLCTVKLVEIDWTELDLDSQPLAWPRTVDGQRLPFVDGVLILYDVTNLESIEKLPESLGAFARAHLPALVVSCKCDASQRQIDPNRIEQVGMVNGCRFDTMQTSATSTGSQRKCLNAILSMVSKKKEKNQRHLNGRRRANSSATNNGRATSPRPSTSRSGHSRASSEFSSTYMKEYPEGPPHGAHGSKARIPRSPINPTIGSLAIQNSSSAPSSSPSVDTRTARSASGAPQITLSASSGPLLEVVSTAPFSVSQPQLLRQAQNDSPQLYSLRTGDSFLDMDDDNDAAKDSDDIPILERDGGIDEFETGPKPVQNKGFTFNELVDRLLRQQMSRGDQDFSTVFLCFYRKFAPPRDLLDAMLEKFDETEKDPIVLHRIPTQLRYCGILHQWVSSHPGDFANKGTRQRLLSFLEVISKNRSLAVLVTEMKQRLAQGAEDDDGGWAKSDPEPERQDSLQSFLTGNSTSGSFAEDEGGGYIGAKGGSGAEVSSEKESGWRTSDVASDNLIHPVTSVSQPLLAKLGDPTAPLAGTGWREQYDSFMSISDEEIAAELTRIDWAEFSNIKCRDLVRHVSISADQKERYASLKHVNRMISHFNHVAYWVASVILEKPKPKHRAKALEKFMNIAWTLRHMNNYNALGAVIAGINGTAVHRLSQTRELVSVTAHKQFMRLELLMGTHMSHSKYRLAWENTTTERIPFLPLHRRDLVSADEGNRTFLQDGDKINWNKFQVMGDVLMVMAKSQATPYRDLSGNPTVERLIKEAVTSMNDDELYERSVQLENIGGPVEKSKRRIWFQR